MIQFITDNWLTIAAVLYAATSDIIGISPLKSNSVVQLILTALGTFLKKK